MGGRVKLFLKGHVVSRGLLGGGGRMPADLLGV